MANVSPETERFLGNLTEEQFAGIGRVIVEWSFLEWVIHVGFATMTRTNSLAFGVLPAANDIGMLIAAKIRRPEVLSFIINAAIPDSWPNERRAAVSSLLGEARDLEARRDELAHAIWAVNLGPNRSDVAIGDFRLRAKPQSTIEKTPADLLKTARQIRDVAGKLFWVLIAEHGPWPDKSEP